MIINWIRLVFNKGNISVKFKLEKIHVSSSALEFLVIK